MNDMRSDEDEQRFTERLESIKTAKWIGGVWRPARLVPILSKTGKLGGGADDGDWGRELRRPMIAANYYYNIINDGFMFTRLYLL